MQLGGTLPESWADPGAFPNLREMVISNTSVSGTIPANWGFPRYFPYLQLLNLGSSNLKGNIPAFNNAALAGLDLNDCKLNGSLGMFWSSSAPLQAVSLSSNHISGSLPDVQGALSELTLLDLSDNQMTGIVALSWLQEGNLVSHVSVLDVGDIWPRSVDLTGWRQQLCLQMDLYDLDVTGQQAKLLPVARHSWESYENNFNYNVDDDFDDVSIPAWLQEDTAVSQWTLGYLAQNTNNQLTSVKTSAQMTTQVMFCSVFGWCFVGAACLSWASMCAYNGINCMAQSTLYCGGICCMFAKLLRLCMRCAMG